MDIGVIAHIAFDINVFFSTLFSRNAAQRQIQFLLNLGVNKLSALTAGINSSAHRPMMIDYSVENSLVDLDGDAHA